MSNPLLGTEVVTQIGILVHDIEKARHDYAHFFGVEPPQVILTGPWEETSARYLGQDTQARAKLAFFHVGPQVDIELIEPDQHPSTWRQDLDERGEGFHHIAFVVGGMRERIATLEANGMPLLQAGEYPGGRYAYLDARQALKVVLELLENDN